MCLATAEKVLWPILMCRLSGNNRPITDYLKNGRLIGFADYLPINRLIPSKIYKPIDKKGLALLSSKSLFQSHYCHLSQRVFGGGG
jgi:hypothetical protein